ncbi:hypothetical protein COU78_01425 [Candidatus Peregrinibacteria bacterium CG10_big_fil_rev_8_21_14_0_10_49_24]|nr:MAG: hypothetical protein COV83_04390 [Candidatus Peregrinibacteria bacterium CG11_big_fil_rev_8_21_14_0_20_49_14]PIR51386.1 MAG: hypothetical protein COU78_01425 [Candidatus Peregrinibacteria bacterium CG10_big_fil_rev_8_21_14_0_10_49_24]PJA68150.1 MAG: hypothetical protein CO157_01240 [Candidatus Peregrinibacteria bacterium CG_4_9_14_3_um_filter_49_12]
MTKSSHSATKGPYRKALQTAKKAHEGQKRASGSPYIEHPIAVAHILKGIHAGEETIAAALLHDTVEDTDITIEDIKKDFGPTVAKLVEGVTKVEKIEKDIGPNERNMQSIRKMFRAMGHDMRVIFIKLADRLHNMQTIDHLRKEKQQRIARETRDIFCPLANLLGIRNWYQELSDLAFKALEPTEYDLLERRQKAATEKDIKHLQRWVQRMRVFMKENGFASADIELRPRHLHGIYESTQAQMTLLQHIETFYRVYIITKKQDDCYRILNYLHQFSSSLPHHIHDYISHPKANGYQALHTTVMSSLGNPIKIIVQTKDMDIQGRFGATIPFQKKGEKPWGRLPLWVEQLTSLENDTEDLPHFFQAVQSEILGERCRVHVVGEKQEFIDLPCHSSMLDVAYYVSENTGLYATNAIVNSEESNLKRIIKDADVIEIISAKKGIQRTAEDLNYVHSSLGQKLLVEGLRVLSKREKYRRGKELLSHMLDISMDPFNSTEWKKSLLRKLCAQRSEVENVGCGIVNPFDLMKEQCLAEELLLLDPRCFQFTARLTPLQKIRFILRTSIESLQRKKVIGLQIRPDVIEVLSVESNEKEKPLRHTKELVPLSIGNPALLEHPFYFALMWSFEPGSNPLKTIANLQNLLDTPIALLQFDRTSVTLGFHTDRIGTVRIAYEYLFSQSDITRIVRISP